MVTVENSLLEWYRQIVEVGRSLRKGAEAGMKLGV
jgi:hypothetical protein